MPGKSRHGKRKHYQQSQKLRAGQHPVAINSTQAEVARTPRAAARVSTPPPAKAPSPRAPGATQYNYLATDLRNTGILTVIIFIILIVLSRIIS